MRLNGRMVSGVYAHDEPTRLRRKHNRQSRYRASPPVPNGHTGALSLRRCAVSRAEQSRIPRCLLQWMRNLASATASLVRRQVARIASEEIQRQGSGLPTPGSCPTEEVQAVRDQKQPPIYLANIPEAALGGLAGCASVGPEEDLVEMEGWQHLDRPTRISPCASAVPYEG